MSRLFFSITILYASMFFVGCQRTDVTPAKQQPGPDNGMLTVRNQDGVLVNDIGIATFATPQGWQPLRSDGSTAIIIGRPNATPANSEEMITIDVGAPIENTVQKSAIAVASKFSGRSSKMDLVIDGEEAYQVVIPPDYKKLKPRHCIVVHHGDRVLYIFGGSKSTNDIWSPVMEIARSLKWK